MSVGTWLAVMALGGVGALTRFVVDAVVALRLPSDLPLGTLAVNLSGALVLGVLVGAAVDGDAYLLAGTAALGSYTTFSTWMLETHRLVEQGEPLDALGNVVLSLALGLGAVTVGHALGGRL